MLELWPLIKVSDSWSIYKSMTGINQIQKLHHHIFLVEMLQFFYFQNIFSCPVLWIKPTVGDNMLQNMLHTAPALCL